MGARFSGGDDVIADINITPFVDIILVVLIIFMVTASTIVRESLKVTLPDAATADANQGISLGITLRRDGALLLDGSPLDAGALSERLQAARAEAGDDVVLLISADKDVPHGRVVWLMDLARSHGVARQAFNINRAEAVGPDPALGTARPAGRD